MAKSANAVEVKDSITSLKDGAYKQALARSEERRVGKECRL